MSKFTTQNSYVIANLCSIHVIILIDLFVVQSLRRDKVLRVFKLNTGQDDHAIMFLDDYLNQVGCIPLPLVYTCV